MIPIFASLILATPFVDANVDVVEQKGGGIVIMRPGLETPIFAFNAPADGRPYVHPLLAPDGQGVLTEFSPSHHKHQTGIYVGFLKVNGRDYFHNRGGDHFRRASFKHKNDSQGVRWTATYELLGKDGKAMLIETQEWHFRDFTKSYLIDLVHTLKAIDNVRFDAHDYGGLFIRMPWKNQKDAQAINSNRQVNGKAEGQEAGWVDIGMTVEGGKNAGHIAVIARGTPRWRVDGQLGVGSRHGGWNIAIGDSVSSRYRFLVYTGVFQPDRVEAEWKALSTIK